MAVGRRRHRTFAIEAIAMMLIIVVRVVNFDSDSDFDRFESIIGIKAKLASDSIDCQCCDFYFTVNVEAFTGERWLDGSSCYDFNSTIAYGCGLPLDQRLFTKTARPFTVANHGDPVIKLFS